jgi:hypothetical protein
LPPYQEERQGLAQVDVSTSSDLEPGAAWKLASDLGRFDPIGKVVARVLRSDVRKSVNNLAALH